MRYLDSKYHIDDEGNFESPSEFQSAVENEGFVETSHGYWDKSSGTEYYNDGSVRE